MVTPSIDASIIILEMKKCKYPPPVIFSKIGEKKFTLVNAFKIEI